MKMEMKKPFHDANYTQQILQQQRLRSEHTERN